MMKLKYRSTVISLGLILINFMNPLIAAERRPIIDVHVHSGLGPENFLPYAPPYQFCRHPFVMADPSTRIRKDGIRRISDIYECKGEKLVSPTTNAELKKQLFAEFRKYNYVAALNSGVNVDEMEKWAEESPVKLTLQGLAIWRGSPDLNAVKKLAEQGRIDVVGEIAVQYDGRPVNDPYLDPYYALAQEYNLPVAVHITGGAPGNDYIGYHTRNTYRSDLTNPLAMEDVLRRYPDLRVYIMHAGWPMLDEMLLLMYMHPQVYVDVAMFMTVLPRKEGHRYLRTLVEAGMGKRIMYGSDHSVWPGLVGEAVEAIESAEFLAEEEKDDIFFNNAVRFFRLDADELLK